MQRRRRRRQPCAVRLREYCRQFVAFMFSNVGVIGLVVGYIIAGAFIFQAIEGSSEIERVQGMARARAEAADRLWRRAALPLNVFDETLWKFNVSAELQEYQRIVVKAVRHGWDGSDDTKYYRQWSFPGAFLYSLTVITTIGYGNISPRTDWGKVTTIFYAIIGMPLFLLYLTNIGNVLARSFKWFYVYVCLCRGCPGIAKKRATRLRIQMQTQFGEQLDTLEYAAAERGRSAPECRPRERCSGPERPLCRGLSDEHRYPQGPHRGVSEPCSSRQFESSLPRQNLRHLDTNESCNKRDSFYEHSYKLSESFELDDLPDYYDDHKKKIDDRRSDCYDRSKNIQKYEPDRYDFYQRYENMGNRRQQNQNVGYRDKPLGRCNTNQRAEHLKYGFEGLYDPADNYGDIEGVGDEYGMERHSEVVDSDEFTYITIDSHTVTVPITICVFIMVGYIIFGAMLFGMWEDWDRVDGSYFCFISLTSIGFGDIVPGERIYARATPNESVKKIDTSFILCSMYLLFGMALIAMCFNLMQEQVVQYMAAAKRVLRRMCRCKR